MHILTGLLLGELLLGKKALFGGRNVGPPFELVHFVRGRVRFRVARVRGDAAVARRFVETLGVLPGVLEVTADARTGSVTVRFDDQPEARQAIITRLQGLVAALGEEQSAAPKVEEKSLDRPLLHEQLRALARAANASVREQTHGIVDLETLAGVALLGFGLKRVLLPAAASRWSGVTMLYWSYNILRR